jgi:phospholipase D1/2
VVKKRASRKPAWGKIAAIVIVFAALAAAWRWTPLAEIVTAENILGWSRAVRDTWWAPFAMVAAYTVGAFVLLPRPLMTLVSVLTFGVWLGIALATAGVLVSALVTYYMGRLMPRERVRRLAGDAVDAAAKPLQRHGVISVFAANMLPTPPFIVQNMIAGAVRIPFWQFIAGTALALIPGILAWTVFGDQITTALEDGSKTSFWIIGVTVLALAVFIVFARRWASGKGLYGT